MNTKRFTVDNDGMKIQGIAYLPANSTAPNQVKKSPAIIMSHGYLSNLHNFEYFATQFAMIGYNVFTFNFCCGSDETDPELMSDGTTTNLCIEGEISDLIAVYNYVSTRDYVKSDEIILWGESQGAFVSGLTAARLQEKISKLVMIFPAVCIPDHARRGTLGGASYDPKNPPELIYTERAMLSKVFVDDVKDMDAYSELAKYKGATLLIQGTCDSIVVPEYQYIVKKEFDLTDNIENENAQITNSNHRLKLQMVRGMDHYTGGEHKEALKDSIRYFIEGKEEIFSFRIIVTNVVVTDDSGSILSQDVHFTGYCESDLFTGAIIQGVDHQKYIQNIKNNNQNSNCNKINIQELTHTEKIINQEPTDKVELNIQELTDTLEPDNKNETATCIEMRAEYTFSGVDADGKPCKLDVCNIKRDGEWRPTIKTDSKALSWINDAKLYAIVEPGTKGPTIRIYKEPL